jgi:hypothetical protein
VNEALEEIALFGWSRTPRVLELLVRFEVGADANQLESC